MKTEKEIIKEVFKMWGSQTEEDYPRTQRAYNRSCINMMKEALQIQKQEFKELLDKSIRLSKEAIKYYDDNKETLKKAFNMEIHSLEELKLKLGVSGE